MSISCYSGCLVLTLDQSAALLKLSRVIYVGNSVTQKVEAGGSKVQRHPRKLVS